ncbi:MAG: hypothetical protein AAGF53_06430 [Pseudomonadota bacterium]
MSTLQNMIQLSGKLEQAIHVGDLPQRYKSMGAQLLSQLKRPVQISFVGLPKSGKTSLIRMMMNDASIPAITDAHVVELVYGNERATRFEYSDGYIQHCEGLTSAPEAYNAELFRVVLEMPDAGLRLRSFTEVSLTGDADKVQSLLSYAAQYSTIVVWCAEVFGADEKAYWQSLPDHIKDHGFLALTMADRQIMKGSLEARIDELTDFVAEEFFGLYPVAALQAFAARSDADNTPSEQWARSGGEALYDAVERQVKLGRSEELDRARMLLRQVPEAACQLNAQPMSVCSENTVQETAPEKSSVGKAKPSEITNQTLQAALREMKSSAEQMLEQSSGLEASDYADILQGCIDTVRDVSETLSEAAQDPAIADLIQDAQEGEDMLLLLQLEHSEASATDAVALMLQLNKEIAFQAQV